MAKKKNKQKLHITYNQKAFLSPNSIRSMAAIHTKIKASGECSIRISDCNNSVKIWNDLNNKEEVHEMIEKIETIENYLKSLKSEVLFKLSNQ